MSQEAIELVRSTFHEWNQEGNLPPDEAFTDDFELHSPLAEEHGEPYRGAAGMHRWLHDLSERLPDYTFEPERIEPHGSRLLVLGKIQHEGLGSAAGYTAPAALVIDVREGRLARVEIFTDQQEARAACDESRSGA